MKLYMHPVSTTSRPIVLFMADNTIEAENVVVDLMTGEHMAEAFGEINPNHLVPVLEDGDFRLTESSAILKYLADKVDSPAYPKDLQARAKVNAMMDWLNADFYRDWGYGLIYPQIFPHHKRQSDEAQTATMDWARERARGAAPPPGYSRPGLDRAEPSLSLRRRGHHRRLFWHGHLLARRGGALRSFRLSQCRPLDRQHEKPGELGFGERNILWLCGLGQGAALHRALDRLRRSHAELGEGGADTLPDRLVDGNTARLALGAVGGFEIAGHLYGGLALGYGAVVQVVDEL